MQTYLPELPFIGYGNVELNQGLHTGVKTAPRPYPRTDLNNLIPWTSFPDDIHNAIQDAMARSNLDGTTALTINPLTRSTVVANEEMIRAHATYALHAPVKDVVCRLGVEGDFTNSGAGNAAIIGSPDFSWVMDHAHPHPKLIVEYKSWWVANLEDLPATHHAVTRHTTLTRQSLEALQQLYGYMTFNENKFGILTNWQLVWFFRRAETPDRKTLEYYSLRLDEASAASTQMSMLKAWVGMVLLADDSWFYYASPSLSIPPPERSYRPSQTAQNEWTRAIASAKDFQMQPVDGQYSCLQIDFRLCQFEKSSIRVAAKGCVVSARLIIPPILGSDINVICKIVDVLRHPDAGESLQTEANVYAALNPLQGVVIPKLRGFYEVWGILKFLALEDVGKAISEDQTINWRLRRMMKAALQRIHEQGYVHGDIARRNFCKMRNGRKTEVFLVDLELCRHLEGSEAENQILYDIEMGQVDSL